MPRVARAVIPDLPHHITQRGNNRQDTFFVDSDHRFYLRLLREQAEKFGLRVLGYCLMTNHVHLIAIPASEDSLAKAVGRTHWLYAQYVNRLHRRSGHLWQGRFYSCALEEERLRAGMRYVERNPVRAGMVRRAWEYEWSSAGAHTGSADRTGLLDVGMWYDRVEAEEWKEFLSKAEAEEELQAFRIHTRTGRPLASDGFLSKLEVAMGRRLRPLPIGRPRKVREKGQK